MNKNYQSQPNIIFLLIMTKANAISVILLNNNTMTVNSKYYDSKLFYQCEHYLYTCVNKLPVLTIYGHHVT